MPANASRKASAMRQCLTDGTGRFFYPQKAERYDESVYFDGENVISRATGSQWDHETLYRTAGGRWILHSWSQRQGTPETWEEVDEATAVKWLVINRYEDVPEIEEEVASLEV